MKPEMADFARNTVRHALDRLVADEPNRLQAYTREMELIENLTPHLPPHAPPRRSRGRMTALPFRMRTALEPLG